MTATQWRCLWGMSVVLSEASFYSGVVLSKEIHEFECLETFSRD